MCYRRSGDVELSRYQQEPSRLRKRWLLSRQRTPPAEADIDVAGLMARLNVVPFPVWSLTGVFPQPVKGCPDTNLHCTATRSCVLWTEDVFLKPQPLPLS